MSSGKQEFEHFVSAQAAVYAQVLQELKAGRKTSHWMWFIFPQLRGLGYSMMSRRFAIDDLDQARRYLAHEILGQRLVECTQCVLNVKNRTALEIFGHIDAMKFHSSMTLFSLCSPPESVFHSALQKYFNGLPDKNTLRLLGLSGEDSVS